MEYLSQFLINNNVKVLANLESLFNNLHDVLTVQDTEQTIIWANQAAVESASLSSVEELRGEPCYRIWHDQKEPCKVCAVSQALHDRSYREIEVEGHGGKTFLKRAYPFENKAGEIIGVVEIALDITEKRKAERLIKFQAEHDYLTGLPNLHYITRGFNKIKEQNNKIAFISIELDMFGEVNAALGYAEGDKILKFIADNINTYLGENDLLARIGGDNFVILVNIPDRKALLEAMESTLKNVKAEMIKEHNIYISASMGCSIFPDDSEKFNILFQKADMALKEAKKFGGDSIKFYHPEMNPPTSQLMLLKDLKNALDNNRELTLYYQPQLNREAKLVGLEALIRWEHPELGFLSPGKFIPLAESTGLSVRLDKWVIKKACQDLQQFKQFGFSSLQMSVNVSARQFSQQDFILYLQQVIDETNINPRQLVLEITERTAIQNMDFTIDMLAKLKEIGVEIAIDDFGTGYSSLKYLQEMDVDYLKIDKSFIFNLNFNNKIIANSIIGLAHNLKLKVIGEGVETAEQFNFLKEKKCDLYQGYYFSRPVEFDEIKKKLI